MTIKETDQGDFTIEATYAQIPEGKTFRFADPEAEKTAWRKENGGCVDGQRRLVYIPCNAAVLIQPDKFQDVQLIEYLLLCTQTAEIRIKQNINNISHATKAKKRVAQLETELEREQAAIEWLTRQYINANAGAKHGNTD